MVRWVDDETHPVCVRSWDDMSSVRRDHVFREPTHLIQLFDLVPERFRGCP